MNLRQLLTEARIVGPVYIVIDQGAYSTFENSPSQLIDQYDVIEAYDVASIGDFAAEDILGMDVYVVFGSWDEIEHALYHWKADIAPITICVKDPGTWEETE